ncbi:MAG: hypothetical protein WC761_01705 [Candidatus Paceibacterota bacterium]|jgi:hypothetical protein
MSISTPILFIRDDIQSPFGIPATIYPTVFFSAIAPTEHWSKIRDPRCVRMDKNLLASVFFPQGIDGRKDWIRCVIAYDTYTQSPNYFQKAAAPPKYEINNPIYHFSCSAEKINVKTGWMHRLDALFFRDNVLRGEDRLQAEEARYKKWKSF